MENVSIWWRHVGAEAWSLKPSCSCKIRSLYLIWSVALLLMAWWCKEPEPCFIIKTSFSIKLFWFIYLFGKFWWWSLWSFYFWYDDVIKWRHFPHYWPFVRGIYRSPVVNSPYKGQWRGALMFSLICVSTNGWVNNRDAADLRHHWAHYDITVMIRQNMWESCQYCFFDSNCIIIIMCYIQPSTKVFGFHLRFLLNLNKAFCPKAFGFHVAFFLTFVCDMLFLAFLLPEANYLNDCYTNIYFPVLSPLRPCRFPKSDKEPTLTYACRVIKSQAPSIYYDFFLQSDS